MKLWHLLIPILLVAAACQLSPLTQEQVAILEGKAQEASKAADAAETDDERLAAMALEKELRQEISRLKAEDHGKQSGYLMELVYTALGLGGLGAARTFGKSRGSAELASLRAKIEAFESGYNQPVHLHASPPDVTDNKPT